MNVSHRSNTNTTRQRVNERHSVYKHEAQASGRCSVYEHEAQASERITYLLARRARIVVLLDDESCLH